MLNLNPIQERLEKIQAQLPSLKDYDKKVREISSSSKMMAASYLRDLIVAQDATNNLYMLAMACELDAERLVKEAKAIAFLDKSTTYITGNGGKATDVAKKFYVDMDGDVKGASDMRNRAVAIATFLRDKSHIYRMAHDDLKKITYSDEYKTPYEGVR